MESSREWCILTSRFGDLKSESPPNDASLLLAATEVLDEAGLRLRRRHINEADLAEHPNAWLEAGADSGALHVLDLYRSGRLNYTKYSDVDMTDEVASTSLSGAGVTRAVELWRALREGDIRAIEEAFHVECL